MRRVHLMAFLLAALPHSAHAQDYPFTGAFTAAGRTDAPDPDDPARCALAFFTQSPSGAYVNYVVDMNAFNTTQTLHHRVSAAFARCPFDPARLTDRKSVV